eukprot:TRINITY_DN1373_c0_g1_i3.p1 TRINITY_DN1373_c0_g1~~TRINITY_DN1373_c0_g1_i3.p1  ORF type:complete len:331 (+),score=66.20 TRINITY_DN1373_c0_g1_i3:66-995(+)
MSSDSDGDADDEVPDFISLGNLTNKVELAAIIENMNRSYYVTPCWKPDFYAMLCYCGFVSVAQEPTWLIPELQREYALLKLEDLYLERNVIRRMKNNNNLRLSVDQRPDEVYQKIKDARESNWLGEQYWAMMRRSAGGIQVGKGFFRPHTFELVDTSTGELIAGEIGYSLGHTYTALTGFYDPRYPSSGKIQICSTCLFLETKGIRYINLGHAKMKYKYEFGCKDIPRHEFLQGWNQNTSGKCNIAGEAVPSDLLLHYQRSLPVQTPQRADPTSKKQLKKEQKRKFRFENKKRKAEERGPMLVKTLTAS